jgi:hypothetical protein
LPVTNIEKILDRSSVSFEAKRLAGVAEWLSEHDRELGE